MTEHPTLFQVGITTASQCPVCGAIRPAGEQKALACTHDQDREGRRPAGCLNAHDPKHADLPF